MDWTIFTQVTLPMLGGFAWMVIRMDKKFDGIEKKIDELSNRLSRLEGRFEERGYWESRDKKIGE